MRTYHSRPICVILRIRKRRVAYMFVWNKREVYSGPDQGRFLRICQALDKDHIRYEKTIQNLEYTKLITLRVLVGSFGREEPDYKYWFTISVHKKDQERAEYWVRRTV